MLENIICHYTFHSNEISPVGAFFMLLFMGIFLIVAIRIWIGNKVDDYKLNKEIKTRDAYLAEEAEQYLSSLYATNEKIRRIKQTYNWKNWFIKGYREGAVSYNSHHRTSGPYKPINEFTLEEWEKYQTLSMQHIKENSDYFGGNKEMAIYAYFYGHKLGSKRYEEKGRADL